MKYIITCKYVVDITPHFFCSTKLQDGATIQACGDNWELARKSLIVKLKDLEERPPIPPDETVEI